MSGKGIKRYFKIFFLSLLFLVLVAEIFLRIKYKNELKIRHYPLIYRPDSLLGYTYIPNTVSSIVEPGIEKTFTINSNGYYGPSFSLQKTAKIRIALVGSSEAGGIWLNGEKNYAIRLQELINEHGINAEVINFSMDGRQRDLNNVNLVRKDVARYKPDYILLTTFIPFVTGGFMRDVYKDYTMIYSSEYPNSREWCKAKIDYITEHKFLSGLYHCSYIVRAICRRYMYHSNGQYVGNLKVFVEKRLQAPDIRFLPFSITKTVKILKNLQDSLENVQGTKLIFFDYNQNPKQQELLNSYHLNNISLDIPKTDDMHYEMDGHYNEKAHSIIAQQFFDTLVARKYLY